jgi:hypothetical protein
MGFSLPPPSPVSPSQFIDLQDFTRTGSLPLAGGGGAAEWIEIPELDVFGEVLDPDFSVHVGAGPTEPDYAELGLGALVLEIDDVTWFELSADALQRSAAAANGAQAGGLGERARVRIHSPDLYGKLDRNALLTAAVHGYLVWLWGMVEGRGKETQVTGVTGSRFPKFGAWKNSSSRTHLEHP